jgi:two-component system chemotaxis response regulator CheY
MEQSKIKILIIDDDEDILNLYSVYLNTQGFNVVGTALNGYDALKLLQDSIPKPDVILIDYHMPHMNGIETSKFILRLDNSYKILMMSGNTSIKDKALSSGIIDFYEKPTNMKILCNRIRELKKI